MGTLFLDSGMTKKKEAKRRGRVSGQVRLEKKKKKHYHNCVQLRRTLKKGSLSFLSAKSSFQFSTLRTHFLLSSVLDLEKRNLNRKLKALSSTIQEEV